MSNIHSRYVYATYIFPHQRLLRRLFMSHDIGTPFFISFRSGSAKLEM